ncbi:Alpha/Beta hydrolase protein [Dichotomopilus funicola]|uniref:Alpha/Beta hydrolase protein n=1 Tax=Dichotomopilus funicola TaxID=1934379 RepID=A0AAN6UUP0_9PEZI|nr:Alpha/Beta hydrolase protein [Dichotomopilus funicola]
MAATSSRPGPHTLQSYAPLALPPQLNRLEDIFDTPSISHVDPLTIEVPPETLSPNNTNPQENANLDKGGFLPAFLHLPHDFRRPPPQTPPSSTHNIHPNSPHTNRTAALLLSGAGGGLAGPSSIYLGLACKLAALGHGKAQGIPTLRMDYRDPGDTRGCVRDVRAAVGFLGRKYGVRRVVLVGWSVGGEVVFGVSSLGAEVVGCATMAGRGLEQTGDRGVDAMEGVRHMGREGRPVLLLHGSEDGTVGVGCSRKVLDDGLGDVLLRVFEGDNHTLSKNAEEAEVMLCEFVARCAGVRLGGRDRKSVVETELVEDVERLSLMRRGGDLRGERVD